MSDPNARALGGNNGDKFRNIEKHKEVVATVYNMDEFAKECVRVICELTGCDRTKVGAAPTPISR